jgi:hypothetical protein
VAVSKKLAVTSLAVESPTSPPRTLPELPDKEPTA